MGDIMVPDISVRLEVLQGDSVAEQIQSAADYGFDAIALPGRFKDRWLPGLRDCLKDRPLPMASISLGFVHSLLSPASEQRSECRDSLRRLLDLCAEFDVGLLNVPPCLIQDNPERICEAGDHSSITERLDELLLEQLAGLADEARDRAVILLLEPVNKYESDYLNSVGHAAAIARRLNHSAVAVTADFFHMQMEELHMELALTEAMPCVQHVHVAENTRVEPGPGSLDFSPGFKALKESGYSGLIEVECRYLSGPAGEVLPLSADYLRQIWAEA